MTKAILALEDGRTFACRSFTGPGEVGGEVVFNTSMSGYQEVLTDPSYSGQMVTMTYPLIGNYGVNTEDVESDQVQVAAFLIREYQPNYSNYRATGSLADYLAQRHPGGGGAGHPGPDPPHPQRRRPARGDFHGGDRPGGAGAKARALTPHGRPGPGPHGDQADRLPLGRWPPRTHRRRPHPAGQPHLARAAVKSALWWRSISASNTTSCAHGGARHGNRGGTGLHRADTIRQMAPDGIFLSNGPGDPEPVAYGIRTVRELLGFRPIFGICLGHQILGLALGAKTYKLKFGHRGANHPVKHLRTGRVEITSQNHGFAVDAQTLDPDKIEITHINLNDNTLEGFATSRFPCWPFSTIPRRRPAPMTRATCSTRSQEMMKADTNAQPDPTKSTPILIIGAGPIIIGQACEFDYSGTQACKALKEEGYQVVLVNSNPATIMTDPETADRTYIEPVTPDTVAKIIAVERPDALLPTLGGQTGLNTAVKVAEMGVLEQYGVELIGASLEAIQKAESRELFRAAMERIGLKSADQRLCHLHGEARAIAADIGFPLIIRPSFTLGGTGGGVAYNPEELEVVAKSGLDASFTRQIMVEQSMLGWKEYELEVMRDHKDNVVIICSIENLDPMGVHTGDSITVAPAQTLSDREYQSCATPPWPSCARSAWTRAAPMCSSPSIPGTGEMIVVEMNPRVSRSSALASKATGFPIAKIAAKLAVGYTLDEITNDITGETLASFEPTLDYCVVKIPRWTFEKFPETADVLTTSMKSVGETMAIGRTFKEALQKGLRSLEIGRHGLGADGRDRMETDGDFPSDVEIRQKLATPNSQRLFYLRYALLAGLSIEAIHALTGIDPWFLHQMQQIVDMENQLRARQLAGSDGDAWSTMDDELLWQAKAWGFSDVQLAHLLGGDARAPSPAPQGARHPAGLQAGGHLRGRVSRRHPLLLLHL
jgi:carbamoylphosphate synthase large subunit/carbamoylphosphate synthase small subunit